MAYIQAFKGSNRLANGRKGKEYWRYFVVIPKALVDALGWKKRDEVEFRLEKGRVVLKRKDI